MIDIPFYPVTQTGHLADTDGNILLTEQGESQRPKYYSVMDHDVNNRIMASGRNSTTLKEVADDMFSYMSPDFGDDSKSWKKAFQEDIVGELWGFNFEVIGHNKLINENY